MEIRKTFTGRELNAIKLENKLESVTKSIIEPALSLLVKKGRFVKTKMNKNPLCLDVYIEVNEDEIIKLNEQIEIQEEYISDLKVYYLSQMSELKKKYSGEKLDKKVEKEEEKQKKALEYEAKELEKLEDKLKTAKEDLAKELDSLYTFSMAQGMRLLKIDEILKVEMGEKFDRGEPLLAPAPQAIEVKEAPPVIDAEDASKEVAAPAPNVFELVKTVITQESAAQAAAIASESTSTMAEVAAASMTAPESTQAAPEVVPETTPEATVPEPDTTGEHLTQAVANFAAAPLEGLEEEPAVVLPFPREKGNKGKGVGKFKK